MRHFSLLLVASMMAICAQAQVKHFLLNDSIPVTDQKADTLATDTLSKKNDQKKKESEYEKLVKKGGVTIEGLFLVRHIEDKYYFEVADSLMGRMLLCVTRFTSVPQGLGQFAGEEITHNTVYFEQRDTTQLLMREYVQSHFSNPEDQISLTLNRATVDPMVMAFKIIGRNEADDASLIEVTPLFKSDSHLTSFSNTMKTQLKVGGLQADRTYIDTLMVFPQNIEVATTRTYGSSGTNSPAARTGSLTMAFNTSIVLLPEVPMRKRLWDDRVGYFVNNMTIFSDDQHKTQHESFISRYRLVPKDKKKYLAGKLVEPEKQIVYYIDPATPKKWVPYLIQGVNDWNEAFEAAGFKNAIVAKELPEDGSISLDDARYSAIRYLPSETENAYGPRIVDPRSGEIIEAHICWYHNVMNLLTKWYMVQCGPLDKRAQTMKFDDKLMGELIRFVSSHEVGHSLGLRHNMGASSGTPVENLRNKQWVEAHGHTASIMDYARFNYVAQPEDKISPKGLFPRINDYDKWAIKWGYQWRPEFKDEYEEKDKLMSETTKVLRQKPRLWFGGEGQGEDPRAQTEDLGDNSMKASEYGLKNLKRVMSALPKWTHEDNDQYDDLSEMYKAVQDQFNRYQNHVMKNIAGRYRNNMPGQEPHAFVPAARQKEALEYIGRNIFTAPEWLYPENIIYKTGTDPTNTQNSRQDNLIGRLLSANTLNTLCNNGDYAVGSYLSDLFAQVWTMPEGMSEWQQKERRNLQRSYIAQIDRLLNPDPKAVAITRVDQSDVLLYLLQHLDDIDEYCRKQLSPLSQPSSIAALHYQDVLNKTKLIREKRTNVSGGGHI
ncbi:MAG: zinc-dependent metalloprotease [Prevotella sp.]|nr:zinc-dependent metalloprotease [Prevotella sp.]